VLRSDVYVVERPDESSPALTIDVCDEDALKRLLEYVGAPPSSCGVLFGTPVRGALVESAAELREHAQTSLDPEVVHIVRATPTLDEIARDPEFRSDGLVLRTLLGLNASARIKTAHQMLLLRALKRFEPERLKALLKQQVEKDGVLTHALAIAAADPCIALGVLQCMVFSAAGTGMLNAADIAGCTPLHLAINAKDAAKIAYLLSLPSVDVAAKDPRGKTAEDLCVDTNEDEFVDLLAIRKLGAVAAATIEAAAVATSCGLRRVIAAAIDRVLNGITRRGDSMFSEALILYGERQACVLFSLFQRAGFDVDQVWVEKSGLTFAAWSRHIMRLVVCWLVEVGGVDVNKKDAQGMCALHRAVANGNVFKVAYLVELARRGLLDLRAVNKDGETARAVLRNGAPAAWKERDGEEAAAAKVAQITALLDDADISCTSGDMTASDEHERRFDAALSIGDLVTARVMVARGTLDMRTLSPAGRADVLRAVLDTLPSAALAPRYMQRLSAEEQDAAVMLWRGMGPVAAVTALQLLHSWGFDFASPYMVGVGVDAETPLTHAARAHTVPLSAMRFLLETARVSPLGVDGAGRTALEAAVLGGDAAKLQLLLQTRAVTSGTEPATAAMRAAYDRATALGFTLYASWLRAEHCLANGVTLPPSTPLFALSFGCVSEHDAKGLRARHDVRAFQTLMTRGGAVTRGYLNVTTELFESAIRNMEAVLRKASALATAPPLLFLHCCGDGYINTDDGQAVLVLRDAATATATATATAPALTLTRTAYPLARIAARLGKAMNGRGTVLIFADFTQSVRCIHSSAKPVLASFCADAVDDAVGDDTADAAVGVYAAWDVKEPYATAAATAAAAVSSGTNLGPVAAAVLQTLTTHHNGALFDAATVMTAVAAAASASGVCGSCSLSCVHSATFFMPPPARSDEHAQLRWHVESVAGSGIMELPAFERNVIVTPDAYGFPMLFYAMLLPEPRRAGVLDSLKPYIGTDVVTPWQVTPWRGVSPLAWAAADPRMGKSCVQWLLGASAGASAGTSAGAGTTSAQTTPRIVTMVNAKYAHFKPADHASGGNAVLAAAQHINLTNDDIRAVVKTEIEAAAAEAEASASLVGSLGSLKTLVLWFSGYGSKTCLYGVDVDVGATDNGGVDIVREVAKYQHLPVRVVVVADLVTAAPETATTTETAAPETAVAALTAALETVALTPEPETAVKRAKATSAPETFTEHKALHAKFETAVIATCMTAEARAAHSPKCALVSAPKLDDADACAATDVTLERPRASLNRAFADAVFAGRAHDAGPLTHLVAAITRKLCRCADMSTATVSAASAASTASCAE
jgi:hypothetical protein